VSYNYPKPQKKQEKDFNELEELVDDYMNEIEKLEQFSGDETRYFVTEKLEHYIFEAALYAFYGKDVWKYTSERLKIR